MKTITIPADKAFNLYASARNLTRASATGTNTPKAEFHRQAQDLENELFSLIAPEPVVPTPPTPAPEAQNVG